MLDNHLPPVYAFMPNLNNSGLLPSIILEGIMDLMLDGIALRMEPKDAAI